jgi:hypothetical protein
LLDEIAVCALALIFIIIVVSSAVGRRNEEADVRITEQRAGDIVARLSRQESDDMAFIGCTYCFIWMRMYSSQSIYIEVD